MACNLCLTNVSLGLTCNGLQAGKDYITTYMISQLERWGHKFAIVCKTLAGLPFLWIYFRAGIETSSWSMGILGPLAGDISNSYYGPGGNKTYGKEVWRTCCHSILVQHCSFWSCWCSWHRHLRRQRTPSMVSSHCPQCSQSAYPNMVVHKKDKSLSWEVRSRFA